MSTIDHVRPAAQSEDSGWEPFRLLLESQLARCTAEAQATTEALSQSPDDTVLRARRASIERTTEQIYAGFERLVTGTFGACTHCGRAIPVERLEIRPFTPTCVTCS